MTQHDALRKAAILISSLDYRQADSLLDQMGDAQAARVREAVLELNDVSERERDRVLGEFLENRRAPAAPNDSGIEIDDSLARRFEATSQPSAPTEAPAVAEEASPFRFLHEAELTSLANHLQREHPQTIAVVVSHLPPSRAAELLGAWPQRLQLEVMNRVAALDQASPEAIQDIESELETLLTTHVHTVTKRSQGAQAVREILRAMGSQDRRSLLNELALTNARLAKEVGGPTPSENLRPIAAAPPESPRDAPEPSPDSAARTRHARTQPAGPDRVDRRRTAVEPFEFGDLASMDARSLALVIHHADPGHLLLSLAGAERAMFDRMKRELPPSEARHLERRLTRLGPMRLSDVDAAQDAVADVADQLAARGLIPFPAARRHAVRA